MTTAPTSYDQVVYPSMLFRQSHPDRLAVIARLHGLPAPPVETSRMLLVGGGDGLDAIVFAAAFPHATCVNFDIATQPIARGQGWSDAAGLGNVRHATIDIMNAADTLDGPFDYIVAHGIYAWVPDAVRAAVMPMIARLLSPNGVAFVSYNAFPGAHTRLALREMMLHHVRHLTEPAARLAAVRALLRAFVEPLAQDQPIVAAMRREAQAAQAQPDGLLFHDLFNEFYAPQSLLAVTQDAQAQGLRYLGEARGGGLDKGFVDPDRAGLSDADFIDRMQALDFANGRYFRASLFVHATAALVRTVDHHAARSMWVSTQAVDLGDDSFRVGQRTIAVADARRAQILRRLIASKPGATPVADLIDAPDLLAPLCHYALEGVVELSTVPPPFALTPSYRPIASALARLQIAEGAQKIATLDHQMIALEDAALRGLMLLLDGTRDRNALEQDWSVLTGNKNMALDRALQRLAATALLKA